MMQTMQVQSGNVVDFLRQLFELQMESKYFFRGYSDINNLTQHLSEIMTD